MLIIRMPANAVRGLWVVSGLEIMAVPHHMRLRAFRVVFVPALRAQRGLRGRGRDPGAVFARAHAGPVPVWAFTTRTVFWASFYPGFPFVVAAVALPDLDPQPSSACRAKPRIRRWGAIGFCYRGNRIHIIYSMDKSL
jgi:hypothetical protein